LIIVGGSGSIPGVFLGAFALKGLPEILRETQNYRLLIFGMLLVVMMRLRPDSEKALFKVGNYQRCLIMQ